MSYRGRPSKGCESCRARKVKCDESRPVCTRCSKLGGDCVYRDQVDLFFRNQTAFAAQKAKDSWRKRSRSRQRIVSESSSNHQSPPSIQQSLQNAQFSPPHNQYQEALPEELCSEPTASVVGFNDLTIASGVKPDLCRLAYERLIYDFVIFETPNRAPEEPSDALWDFIPYLYERSLEGSCLAITVEAVAYANFANRCNAPKTQPLAEDCLSKGLKLLQTMISDRNSASSDEALCAVYLMGIYDNLSVPSLSKTFVAHRKGADTLFRLHPVDDFHTGSVSTRLYEMIYWQELTGKLQAATPPPIPIRNVITAGQSLPTMYSTSSIHLFQLTHSEANLHAEWHEVKHNKVPPASRLDIQELLQTALDLDAEFQAWESTIPPTWRYTMERNTADVRSKYDLYWRILILESRGTPEEIHSYANLKLCWIWMLYRTSRIFLLRDLLEILNWMLKLPKPNPAQLVQRRKQMPENPTLTSKKSNLATLDNATLQIHHSFATAHLVKIVEKSCSAVIGTLTVPIYGKSSQDVVGMRGYTLMWSLGVIDALLKAGLIPDSGAPSPPTSSEPPYEQHAQSQAASLSSRSNDMSIASPSLVGRPPLNMASLCHQGPVHSSQSSDFPILPPIRPPSTQLSAPQLVNQAPFPSTPKDPELGGKEHVFDSSPRHPFDYSTNLATLNFATIKPAKMDVAARREWINWLLYYMATELGIKKAVAIPATEGYLDFCRSQWKSLLGQ